MPLPEHFYTQDGEEVSLDLLCSDDPGWAANRIRHLTQEVDDLRQALQGIETEEPKKINQIRKIFKTSGHCYDSCGWTECGFWLHQGESSKCMLFGCGVEKNASEALGICNFIYGIDYTGYA